MRTRYFRAALCAFVASMWLAAGPANGQVPPEDLAGLYDGGQMEVAAALELSPDGRFRYFMSYGALDERAAGTWAPADGGVVLTSDPVNAPAFELVSTKSGNGSTFDITLQLPQGMPVQYFSASLLFADGTGRSEDFEEPHLRFKLENGQSVSDVVLQLPIYDVSSAKFEVPAKTRSMQFRFAPNDLGIVNFDHQRLAQEDGAFLLSRADRVLKFRKEEDEPDSVDALEQIEGD